MNKLWGRSVGFAAALVVAALAIAGMAAAAPWQHVRGGEVEVEYNGGFSPKKLSKTKPTPITFNVAAKIKSLSTTEPHPPALREFLIEGDKHGSLHVEGIPACKSGEIQSTTTEAARKACGPSLIGSGKTDVEVKFPEQPPFIAHSELLAFSGGSKGGVTTLFVHAFLTAPVTAAVVTTVKVKKIHKGRYGLLSTATIPKIAGGAGSVVFFTLTLKKGIIRATCTDGKLQARGTAIFAGTSPKLTGTVTRPCTPKG
ncbi:MAG TPA: hypothetical protein VNC16_10970 [Solirubrobacterales bacterium]|jgi:hypothetical protein|nr:hypothetical protein [Solirubrobacterales bacterium]